MSRNARFFRHPVRIYYFVRELKHKADPLAGFRREHVNPIGPVTRTIQHLNHLAQLSLETDDSELSELVLSTYSTLLSRYKCDHDDFDD